MKSSTLIASYLWKDTWSRWLEQPSSLLARFFVGALLTLVATIILISLTLLEQSIRTRMESFGLDTVIVREMISNTDPEFLAAVSRPDRLQALDSSGSKIRLRQLFARADTEFQPNIVVLTYPPDALAPLVQWLAPDQPIVYINSALPENLQVQIALGHQSAPAVVRHPGPFWRPVGIDPFLLIPQGWAPDAERIGFIETTIFQRDPAGRPVQEYASAVNLLFTLDRRTPPQIQTALPLIKELEELKSRQRQWRLLLAGILGFALALVYGAIALLEFRQNLFIGALLRSLGTPARYLYYRQWLENGFIANAAAILAIAGVALFHHKLFGLFGFTQHISDLKSGNPYWSREIILILVWVNIGAFLSSIPVAFGLRQPVGATLN